LEDGDRWSGDRFAVFGSELIISPNDCRKNWGGGALLPALALLLSFAMLDFRELCLAAVVVLLAADSSSGGGTGHSMVSSERYPSEEVVSVCMKLAPARTSWSLVGR